jgi:hypothetical protein
MLNRVISQFNRALAQKNAVHKAIGDGNGSDSGWVDRKSDPRKNKVRLNLTTEPASAGENWHPNLNPLGFRF